jgi:hypothetical protein
MAAWGKNYCAEVREQLRACGLPILCLMSQRLGEIYIATLLTAARESSH